MWRRVPNRGACAALALTMAAGGAALTAASLPAWTAGPDTLPLQDIEQIGPLPAQDDQDAADAPIAVQDPLEVGGVTLGADLAMLRERFPELAVTAGESVGGTLKAGTDLPSIPSSSPQGADAPLPRLIVARRQIEKDGLVTAYSFALTPRPDAEVYQIGIDVTGDGKAMCRDQFAALAFVNGEPELQEKGYRRWRRTSLQDTELLEARCLADGSFVAELENRAILDRYLTRLAAEREQNLRQLSPASVPGPFRR